MQRFSGRWLWAVGLILAVWGAGCDGGEGNGNCNGTGDDGNLVEACIRATACGVKTYARVSACVENYLNREVPYGLAPVCAPIYRCSNRATSCKAIEDCYGATGSCDSTFAARCDGGKAVYCDLIDHVAYSYDCAAAAMTCQIDPQNPWSATCEGAGTPDSTISTAVSCKDGVCQKTGEACTLGVMNRCQGEQLQACLEGVWVTYDCAKLGLGPCKPEGSDNTAWAHCGRIPL